MAGPRKNQNCVTTRGLNCPLCIHGWYVCSFSSHMMIRNDNKTRPNKEQSSHWPTSANDMLTLGSVLSIHTVVWLSQWASQISVAGWKTQAGDTGCYWRPVEMTWTAVIGYEKLIKILSINSLMAFCYWTECQTGCSCCGHQWSLMASLPHGPTCVELLWSVSALSRWFTYIQWCCGWGMCSLGTLSPTLETRAKINTHPNPHQVHLSVRSQTRL